MCVYLWVYTYLYMDISVCVFVESAIVLEHFGQGDERQIGLSEGEEE